MIEYSTGTGSTVRVIDGIIINHGKKALIRTEELIEKHISDIGRREDCNWRG